MEVERVAVIGAGTMGRGIVHAAALGGFRVTLQDVDSGVLERALEGIKKEMQKAVERDRLLEGEMRGGLERISPTESLEEAVEDADLVGLNARLPHTTCARPSSTSPRTPARASPGTRSYPPACPRW